MLNLQAMAMAAFAAFAALFPVGVYVTATFFGYTFSGFGTLSGAPGPMLAAGIIPALATVGGAYFVARRFRQDPAQK